MIHIKCFCLSFAMLVCCGSMTKVSAEESTRKITLENPRIWELAAELSRGYEFRVCSESTLSAKSNSVELTIELDGVTQKEALKESIKLYPNYVCHFDKANKIFNIFPEGSSKLDRKLQTISISNMTIRSIFENEDIFGLRQDEIYFYSGRGNHSWLDTRLSLELHNISLREALNMICVRLPFEARWDVLSMNSMGSTLMFQQWNHKLRNTQDRETGSPIK